MCVHLINRQIRCKYFIASLYMMPEYKSFTHHDYYFHTLIKKKKKLTFPKMFADL